MENVVTVVFEVESEAFKAFTEIRNKPFGMSVPVMRPSSSSEFQRSQMVVAPSFTA